MESKRSYRQRIKRLTSFFYILPIVTMLMSSQLSGCTGLSKVDRHGDKDPQTAVPHRVPYAVPTVPQPRGSRATESRQAGSCTTGRVYYCDHRKQQCGCVEARDITSALRLDIPLR